MPNTNCCVPLCHATSKRHALPIYLKLKKRRTVGNNISNDTLKVNSRGTSECGLHFQGAKTIKKNTNSTQNKSQTHRAKQYEVTSFLSTYCELSTETCSKNVYSLGPRRATDAQHQYAYDILILLSRNLFLNYFTCCIRMNVVYL